MEHITVNNKTFRYHNQGTYVLFPAKVQNGSYSIVNDVFTTGSFDRPIFHLAKRLILPPNDRQIIIYRYRRKEKLQIKSHSPSRTLTHIIILTDNSVTVINDKLQWSTLTFDDTNTSFDFLRDITNLELI